MGLLGAKSMPLWPFSAEREMGPSQPTFPTVFGSWGVGPENSSPEAVLRAPYPPCNDPKKGYLRAALRCQGLLRVC